MLSRSFPTALNARCSLLSGRQRYSRTSTSGREKRNRRCQVSALTIESLPTVEEVFNFENAAVFPFWISMIGFPKSTFTKTVMLSPATSIACGLIYGYLAYQSFLEPEILEAFSSGAQQSLSSLTKGFSYETTVAVGWAHFIAMDLLAGRYIYFDGLKNDFITRHSLVLTLFFGHGRWFILEVFLGFSIWRLKRHNL